ncbi:MAG: hypothetical protein KBC06_01370 [Candidatus Pacebacteria bacterium]|nr:hypothetical protein [Candidatus Paceibacterota bacterium]
MDAESKKLLQDTLELAKENNQMLQSMRRSMRIARLMSIVYWVFIIGSAVGAYYFIQPYVDEVIGIYGSTSEVLKGFNK